MCGRFNYSNTKRLEGDLPPRYNVSPGTNILVVNEDNKPQILNWGYSPAWMKSGMIINAKRETLKSKPTFRHHTKAYTLINGFDGDVTITSGSSTELLGEILLSRFVFPFELVSFVLLAALIGGITLARKDEALIDEDQV